MAFLVDPQTDKGSVTVSLLVLGSVIALGKFLFGSCTSGDVATIVGSLGALYAVRKHSDKGIKP